MGVMASTVTPVIPIPSAGDLETSSALGQCVVCGKETGKKCSKFSQAGGGLDCMYFCSEEHQKSVWKVHRRVCGKYPFEWPSLTESESNEIWIRRDKYCGTGIWSEVVLGITGEEDKESLLHDPELRDAAITVFLEKARTRGQDLDKHNAFIRAIRASAFQSKLFTPDRRVVSIKNTRRLLAEDPFGLMAYILEKHLPENVEEARFGRIEPVPARTALRSNFQHRLLLLVAKLNAEKRLLLN